MNKVLLLAILLGLVSCGIKKEVVKNDNSESVEDYTKVVREFISIVKNKKVVRLSKRVIYPLRREIPLPPVENSDDFTSRFADIFDEELINMIATSDPQSDWGPVGSRGIMLKNGSVWIDYSGTLIAVNYESQAEIENRQKLEEKLKLSLHASVEDFEKNMLTMETEGYRIRVDDMGDSNFRLAFWQVQLRNSETPTGIAFDGERVHDGSGGNHRYLFEAEDYLYEVHVTPLGVKYEASFVFYDEERIKFEQGALKFQR